MKKLVLSALAFTALSAGTGCTPLREVRFDTIQNSSQARANAMMKKYNESFYKEEDNHIVEELELEVVEFDEQLEDNRQRIVVLENIIREIEEIEEVSIVLVESAAVVAISLSDGITDDELINIKKEIEQVVKEVDTSIRYVSITSAPELIERINKLGVSGETEKLNLTEIQREIIANLRPLV